MVLVVGNRWLVAILGELARPGLDSCTCPLPLMGISHEVEVVHAN